MSQSDGRAGLEYAIPAWLVWLADRL